MNNTAQIVWDFFIKEGFTPECTAGIMGNLQQESTMDPCRYQSNGGPGRGIAQWTVNQERFEGLVAHAAKKGKDWTDLQSQLEWIILELQGEDSYTLHLLKQEVGGYEQFKALTDVNQACEMFEACFERAANPKMEKRYQYANEHYNNFASNVQNSPSIEVPNETVEPEVEPEKPENNVEAKPPVKQPSRQPAKKHVKRSAKQIRKGLQKKSINNKNPMNNLENELKNFANGIKKAIIKPLPKKRK